MWRELPAVRGYPRHPERMPRFDTQTIFFRLIYPTTATRIDIERASFSELKITLYLVVLYLFTIAH